MQLWCFCGILTGMFKFLTGRLLLVRVILLLAAGTLVVLGIAAIYAVGHPADPSPASQTGELSGYWQKQVQFAVVGVLAFVAINFVNYRRLGAVSYWIYGGVLVMLAVLLLDKVVDIGFVPVINGTRRWIKIHPALPRIQPSEICKISYVLALAWYLRYRSNYRKFSGLVGPFILTVLPMGLILFEPDLGTVMLMMPVFLTMLFVAGAKIKHLGIIVLLALLVSPVLWHKMRPYQRTRISSVLLQSEWVRQKVKQSPALAEILVGKKKFNESQWQRDEGFHLIRSKYAIASGGLGGYGFRQGPFVKYNFLPARHNDFIFAVIAHQWGFWGCLGVFVLYAIIIGCGLDIAAHNTDPFGKLLAIGIVAMIAVEVVVNVSMALGLMPITGLTLPFLSYGGSSLLVSMVSIGLLNNIGRCRPFSVAGKSFQ